MTRRSSASTLTMTWITSAHDVRASRGRHDDHTNSLQDEMTRVPTETRAELLWDVVATQMFKEFSETVANGPRVTASA